MGKLFDITYIVSAFPVLAAELATTLLVTAVALVLGTAAGTLVALARVRGIPVLSQLARAYVSFIRGTPMIVQLFLSFFAIPSVLGWFGVENTRSVPLITYAFAVCSLHLSGYLAETLRGSLISLGTDQLEAAYSVGMGTAQAYLRLLLPQAFTLALPDLSSLVISTLKDTSLMFNIGLVDIMTRAKLMGAYSQRNLEVYISVGALYVALCLALHLIFGRLERRLRVKKYGQ